MRVKISSDVNVLDLLRPSNLECIGGFVAHSSGTVQRYIEMLPESKAYDQRLSESGRPPCSSFAPSLSFYSAILYLRLNRL